MRDQDDKICYRRHLPHYQPLDATYFVTFRLDGSLPVEVVKRLKQERIEAEKSIKVIKDEIKKEKLLATCRKLYFGKFDTLLDRGETGPKWLQNPEISEIVMEAMHYRDQKVYDLLSYCIMPNHVHLVFDVGRFAESTRRNSVSPYIVTNILWSLKKFTGREANKKLNRSGQFWQHESYDHVVRDGREIERIIRYVLNNPAKAGFVNKWQEWPFSYCKTGFVEM